MADYQCNLAQLELAADMRRAEFITYTKHLQIKYNFVYSYETYAHATVVYIIIMHHAYIADLSDIKSLLKIAVHNKYNLKRTDNKNKA